MYGFPVGVAPTLRHNTAVIPHERIVPAGKTWEQTGLDVPMFRKNGQVGSVSLAPMNGQNWPVAPMNGHNGQLAPMNGQNGQFAPMYGQNGQFAPMYGQNGQFAPMYGQNGQFAPMYGQNGQLASMNGQSGEVAQMNGHNGPLAPMYSDNGQMAMNYGGQTHPMLSYRHSGGGGPPRYSDVSEKSRTVGRTTTGAPFYNGLPQTPTTNIREPKTWGSRSDGPEIRVDEATGIRYEVQYMEVVVPRRRIQRFYR